MSYFVGILGEVRDIFLPGYAEVFSWLNIRFKGISKWAKLKYGT